MTTQKPMRFNNSDYNGLTHTWAYNHERDLRTRCDRMHTRGNTCYSYSTAIAYKIVDKNVLLLAREGFSATTRKQKCVLRKAFAHWTVIEVNSDNIPEDDMCLERLLKKEVEECKEHLNDMLKNIKRNKQGVFALAEDREKFCEYVRTLNELSAYVKHSLYNTETKWNAFILEYSHKLRKYGSDMFNRREQARKEREEKRRVEAIKRHEELENTLQAFTDSGSTSYKEYSAILEKYSVAAHYRKSMIENFFKLNTVEDYQKGYSYIWKAGDIVKTTQYIQVPWKDVELLLKLWKTGKPILGKQAGCYTVLAVNNDYVQVGCHKIPVANLNAIYEEEIKCL